MNIETTQKKRNGSLAISLAVGWTNGWFYLSELKKIKRNKTKQIRIVPELNGVENYILSVERLYFPLYTLFRL